jgi:hypothetical protein
MARNTDFNKIYSATYSNVSRHMCLGDAGADEDTGAGL